MIYILLFVVLWLMSGLVLGYIHSVIINELCMTSRDVVLSMVAGLYNLRAIWDDKIKTIIIFKPKKIKKTTKHGTAK
jgi:hypothetical protein